MSIFLLFSLLLAAVVTGYALGLCVAYKKSDAFSHVLPLALGTTCLAVSHYWGASAGHLSPKSPRFWIATAGFILFLLGLRQIFRLRDKRTGTYVKR